MSNLQTSILYIYIYTRIYSVKQPHIGPAGQLQGEGSLSQFYCWKETSFETKQIQPLEVLNQMFEMIFGNQFQPFFLHEINFHHHSFGSSEPFCVFPGVYSKLNVFRILEVGESFSRPDPGTLVRWIQSLEIPLKQWNLPSGYVKIAIENDHL